MSRQCRRRPANPAFACILACVALLLAPSVGRAQGAEELGLNVHEITPIAASIPTAAASGVKWVRVVAWWKWMEPAQGTIDFTALDQHVNDAVNAGLSVLIMFTSIPPWANGSSPSCDFWGGACSAPPSSATYFGAFAGAVAARYSDRVSYWEIWNEPDYAAFWTGTVTNWVDKIVTPGVAAIRSGDPGATIMGPSTWSNYDSFQSFASASCSQLDVLSAHFYKASMAQVYTSLDSSEFEGWMQSNCNKPIWITESGINSWAVGETQQASDYVAAYQGSLARTRLQKFFIFQWDDGVPPPPNQGWGLVESHLGSYRPKRSFFEVQDYAASLQGIANFTVLRDTFATNIGSRPVGSPLNGTASEVGSRTWGANPTLVFGANEVTTSTGGLNPHVGGISYNPPIDAAKPKNAVEADFIVTGSNWVGLGFSLSDQGGLWGDGQVWAHIRPTGSYTIYASGIDHLIATGTCPVFHSSSLNRLRIEHNRPDNLLSVLVNEAPVLQRFDLDSIGFAPSLAFATAHIQTATGSSAGQTKMDNFRVFSLPDLPFSDGFESGSTAAWSFACAGDAGCSGPPGPPIPEE